MWRSLTTREARARKPLHQARGTHASHRLRNFSRREEGRRRDPLAVRRPEARRGVQGSVATASRSRAFARARCRARCWRRCSAARSSRRSSSSWCRRASSTAAQQHDIQPVAEPIVDDAHLHKGQPFHYSARVEVRSIVEPKDYDGLELGQRAAGGERRGSRRGARAQAPGADRVQADRGAHRAQRRRDVVVARRDRAHRRQEVRQGSDDGRPRRAGGAIRSRAFAQALVGVPLRRQAARGDLRAADQRRERAHRSRARRQDAVLKVTVKESREKQMPALDDEFAKDTGEADTLAELRDKIARASCSPRTRRSAPRGAQGASSSRSCSSATRSWWRRRSSSGSSTR